ncbi:glycosyl transferase family 39 [Segniliparus rotundus DSM 44985]|uniref:Polyprenol-phosphate-mannose--protein mannosyltransferase n=1 Tax=Segniliparus rotundus (strain ATCC BAA-972 / CDC 1076 / CIP 108378 / DSM 44985 / JCM 13578) TaxID=640132 RepID=D6ZE45_SEGRD|nr:phospholipid carrier-dependent glycosyltransferase [Segniliparus rotundus]ADG97325.1 glycosyl transferase family 39 [Segniliparus rotundus DSM 44985]
MTLIGFPWKSLASRRRTGQTRPETGHNNEARREEQPARRLQQLEQTSTSPGPACVSEDFGPLDTWRGWIVTLVLTAVGALLRFWRLGAYSDHGTPIFDEKHYVPQAWQMLGNGGVEDNPAYGLVVHPPLGKQLIAIGESAFGYTPLGWRCVAALFGTLLVLLVIRAARRLTRSTLIGAVAGILVICDGVSHVAARSALLDIFLAVFAFAAFSCVLADRDQVRARLALFLAEGTAGASPLGPRLGARWWRFGAGVLVGLACAVKWSGLYYAVFFGALTLCFDWSARRHYGAKKPLRGALVRDLAPGVQAFLLIPALVYLASYWAWYANDFGYYHYGGPPPGASGAVLAVCAQLPNTLEHLCYWNADSLKFHEHLTNSNGYHHPWESKPWQWPMSLRPVLYYYESGPAAQHCGEANCVGAILQVGTPAMWWLSVPMMLWGLWRMAAAWDWRYAATLAGYGASWLPWFLDFDRQMYFYYASAMAPFLVLGLALCCSDVLGNNGSALWHSNERKISGRLLVCLYVGLVVANFAWLYPILVGDPIPHWRWDSEIWLPSWG